MLRSAESSFVPGFPHSSQARFRSCPSSTAFTAASYLLSDFGGIYAHNCQEDRERCDTPRRYAAHVHVRQHGGRPRFARALLAGARGSIGGLWPCTRPVLEGCWWLAQALRQQDGWPELWPPRDGHLDGWLCRPVDSPGDARRSWRAQGRSVRTWPRCRQRQAVGLITAGQRGLIRTQLWPIVPLAELYFNGFKRVCVALSR